MGKLPLEGIRIADFTQVVQGPYATMLMGQMGAEVIKVETESRTAMDQRMAGGFTNLNGSKKSITINLKDPRGADVAKRLVKVSHVAMENFGTGVMERFGLGYDDLSKVNPDIIMLSSQALGRTGPLKDAIGYFAEASNFAGFSHLTGYREGRPRNGGRHLGGPPHGDAHGIRHTVRRETPPQDGGGAVHPDVHGRDRNLRHTGGHP